MVPRTREKQTRPGAPIAQAPQILPFLPLRAAVPSARSFVVRGLRPSRLIRGTASASGSRHGFPSPPERTVGRRPERINRMALVQSGFQFHALTWFSRPTFPMPMGFHRPRARAGRCCASGGGHASSRSHRRAPLSDSNAAVTTADVGGWTYCGFRRPDGDDGVAERGRWSFPRTTWRREAGGARPHLTLDCHNQRLLRQSWRIRSARRNAAFR